MYITHLKQFFHISHFHVEISKKFKIEASSNEVSKRSIWRRRTLATTFRVISWLKNFLWKNVHNLNNKTVKENNRKKASLRYLSGKSSHEKSELVEQYTSLKVLLNENSANIRHFHDCKNLRGVVHMVINDFNFFSKGFMLSSKRFMQWYFKLVIDFENDNLWFTIKIGSCWS